jgi:hypothetical protein
MKLRAHIHRHADGGWYADIDDDDDDDRQPFDPYWYADGVNSAEEALVLSCQQLAELRHASPRRRVSGWCDDDRSQRPQPMGAPA